MQELSCLDRRSIAVSYETNDCKTELQTPNRFIPLLLVKQVTATTALRPYAIGLVSSALSVVVPGCEVWAAEFACAELTAGHLDSQVFHEWFVYLNSIFREYQYNLSIGEPENFVNDQSPALKCSKEALFTDPYNLLPKAKAPQAQPQVSSFNPHER